MIKVSVSDEVFNRAYWNARRTLPVETLESPRQYGRRWREEFKCRPELIAHTREICYVFDRDEDYTWFMLRWG